MIEPVESLLPARIALKLMGYIHVFDADEAARIMAIRAALWRSILDRAPKAPKPKQKLLSELERHAAAFCALTNDPTRIGMPMVAFTRWLTFLMERGLWRMPDDFAAAWNDLADCLAIDDCNNDAVAAEGTRRTGYAKAWDWHRAITAAGYYTDAERAAA